jgi:hypothetical protein
MQHANPAQFATDPMPSRTSSLPRFDPDHPDADILEAYEGIRACRLRDYAIEDAVAAGAHRPPDECGREGEFERTILGTWATTPAGVAVRLCLALPAVEDESWVDRGLMERGLLPLYNARREIDFTSRLAVTAAYELLHIEWQTALGEYERSVAAADDARKLQALAGAELQRLTESGAGPSDELAELTGRICADQANAEARKAECLTRLLRTLAPELALYRRKIEVIEMEGMQDEAAAWLARDAEFLFASLDRPAPRDSVVVGMAA